MISLNFDRNLLAFVSTPGNPSPTSLKWVYGDNYNVQVSVVKGGIPDTLNSGDSLAVLVYVPGTLPATNVAIIGTPVKTTDANGNDCYQVNVNLFTTALATLVQTPNVTLPFNLRVIFSPVDGERFSSATDVSVTIEPDPSQGSSGATPASGTYPALDGNVSHFLTGLGTWATPSFAGNTYLTTVSSFTIPAAQSTVVTTVASSADLKLGQGIVIVGSSLFINGVITAITGTSVTVKNLGAPGAITGTMGAAHLYIGGPGDLATTSQTGLVKPDGATVLVSSGVISVPTATTSALGLVKPDGTTITDASGAISVPTATSSVLGLVKPDNTTIVNTSGAISVPTATGGALGLVRGDGSTITNASGVLSVPTATTGALGLVKPDGSTITISSGVISGGGIGQHAARSHIGSTLSANTSLASNSALTFDTSDYDTDTYHTGSTWNKLTVPTGQGGYYIVTVSVSFPGSGYTATSGTLAIWKNGSTVEFSLFTISSPLGNTYQASWIGPLVATDYMQAFISYAGGSGSPTFTSGTIAMIRVS